MATNLSRPSTLKALPVTAAKAKVLELIAGGQKVADAMAVVQRSEETYRSWMKDDAGFKVEIQQIRAVRVEEKETGRPAVPDFETFCRDWLRQPLHQHQLRMLDVMEGREPRELHESMRYDVGVQDMTPNTPGDPAGRVIQNVPPGHAKTTSLSINYTTWLIHRNPNIKIIVICKDQTLARDILGAVKFRLTSPMYREMHLRFAPEGGWKDPDNSWTSTAIRVQGKNDGEKDPTIQALGIGGRIYGARSDVIILDDAVTLANVSEYEKHKKWIQQEVESRLDGGGMLAVLGTRIAPTDLYSELRDLTNWSGDKVFTYFSQPALLAEGEGGVATWQPLWPERFPATKLASARRDENMWALVYQQQDVAEDATFNAKAVEASINRERFPGLMTKAGMGHREGGMDGLYVVGGLDPATTGKTAMVVTGVDKVTQKRYVLDGINKGNMHADSLVGEMQRLTLQYSINEWVVERNAFQRFLTQIPQVGRWMQQRGVRLQPHYTTGQNKFDTDFGVQAMAQLFLTCGTEQDGGRGGKWIRTPDTALIELPNPKQNAWVAELINQLVIWQPSGMAAKAKTDVVMALWLAELGIRKVVDRKKSTQSHYNTPFTSPAARSRQKVISLADLRQQKQLEREMEGVG